MNHPRLYLDEDAMRRSLVFGLRARHVDVITAADADMVNRDDDDHLLAAAGFGRTLYSYNVADYCLLHQQWHTEGRQHAGIIVASQQRYPVGDEIRRITHLIRTVTAQQMENRLEFLSAW